MKPFFLITTFVVLLFASVLGTIFHFLTADDAARRQREAEWLTFSMQHHCHVSDPSSFWNAQTTWQCDDNFQVVRGPQ